MPKVDGLQVLRAAGEISPDTAVIVITAVASTETAVEAMKLAPGDGQRAKIDRRARLARPQHLAQVAGEAEAGDVGARAGVHLHRHAGGGGIAPHQ